MQHPVQVVKAPASGSAEDLTPRLPFAWWLVEHGRLSG
ncbi:MAG: hypothetical protein AVDCRST_MAG77-3575 [uncultured Chloroflexi bacterium]|uniref:Uncharacterized protein n=1 Tax=uncultured Chloroflexota bacterium TaxID=166587 RepID=A0A6J4JF62_9CHLR|nr:MAG: hypothetical protein AVDCRST_MAG77-3575 [uncultured Chloroflexota bacterium]